MNLKKMLNLLAAAGFIFLAGAPKRAEAVSLISPNTGLTSFEKITAKFHRYQ